MAVPDPPVLDHPEITLIGLVMESAAGLERAAGRELETASGLTVPWFETLLRLARTPGARLRMNDLAAQSTLTTSGLTRSVDRLEAAGLVRREQCPEDRRGAFAVLTEAGRERIHAAVPEHLTQLRALLAGFDPDERETLAALLRRLRDAVNPDAARASGTPTARAGDARRAPTGDAPTERTGGGHASPGDRNRGGVRGATPS